MSLGVLQRERDVVEAVEQAVPALGVELERHGAAGEAHLERLEVDLGLARLHQRLDLLLRQHDRDAAPILVQLEKKMSAKEDATIAWKP